MIRHSQLSSDKGLTSTRWSVRTKSRANSQRTGLSHRWIVNSRAWENVRGGQCLTAVALNRQLDNALWSNLETRSQRILYIRTLLWVSPNTNRGSTLRIDGTPKREVWSTDRKRRHVKKIFPARSPVLLPFIIDISLGRASRFVIRLRKITWSTLRHQMYRHNFPDFYIIHKCDWNKC